MKSLFSDPELETEINELAEEAFSLSSDDSRQQELFNDLQLKLIMYDFFTDVYINVTGAIKSKKVNLVKEKESARGLYLQKESKASKTGSEKSKKQHIEKSNDDDSWERYEKENNEAALTAEDRVEEKVFAALEREEQSSGAAWRAKQSAARVQIFETFLRVKEKFPTREHKEASFLAYFVTAFVNNIRSEDDYREKKTEYSTKHSLDKQISEKDTFGDMFGDKRANISDELNNENLFVKISLLPEIESFFLQTKHGSENKSIAYTAMIINVLLSLCKNELQQILKEYEFLKNQTDAVLFFYMKKETVDKSGVSSKPYRVTNTEFAQYTGRDKSKLSKLQKQLKKYLEAKINLADYL